MKSEKTVVVISDTHANSPSEINLKEIEKLNPDLIVHAGDFTSYSVYSFLSSFYNLKAVYGNCDEKKLKKELPETLVFKFKSVKFGVKHEPLMPDFSDIRYLARELEVDVMIFGHIHKFALLKGNPLILCAGAFKNNQMAVISVRDVFCTLEFLAGGKVIESLRFKIKQS